MNVPADLKYTRSDEWVRLEGDTAIIGITDYAQHELGELVYIELPSTGDQLKEEVSFGVVESVKAVSELIAPLSGEVVGSNETLSDDPSIVNKEPYEAGWLVKVRLSGSLPSGLLSAAEYAAYRAH